MYLNNSKKTPFSKLKIFKDVWKSEILVELSGGKC